MTETLTKRRKYRFPSRAAAEDAYETLHREHWRAEFAMSALMGGLVDATFKAGPYRVAVIGPTRADGGTVVVEFAPEGQRPMSWAHGLDEWVKEQTRSNPHPDNVEGRQLRDLAYKVLAFANQKMLERARKEVA